MLNDLEDRKGIKQILHEIADTDGETYREIRRAIGFAAIVAMREPTGAMKEMGGKRFAMCSNSRSDHINRLSAASIYEAMIDAELEETDDG